MSGSTNTFLAAMNGTAHAMGDLTATNTATAGAVLPGASIGYAVAVAVAQDTSPHTSATTGGLVSGGSITSSHTDHVSIDFPFGPNPVSADFSITTMSTHGDSDFLSGYSLSGLMGPSVHGLF